jgi:hypothetical protein
MEIEVHALDSRPFQAHLLVGSRKVEQRVQAHCRFLHPWAHAVQCRWLEDRRLHDPLLHQPLDLVQQRLTVAPVALDRLLPEEVIDVGMATIGLGSRAEHKRLDTRGSVAGGARGHHQETLQFLLPQADINAARSMVRIFVRIPIAPR